ncbi:hypothetical protein BD309DRAFT_969462 [Dichomitus squalens]|nr:hypothetical protein BD309DRAFT_969462 [Dichomitus squalens]
MAHSARRRLSWRRPVRQLALALRRLAAIANRLYRAMGACCPRRAKAESHLPIRHGPFRIPCSQPHSLFPRGTRSLEPSTRAAGEAGSLHLPIARASHSPRAPTPLLPGLLYCTSVEYAGATSGRHR